MTRVRLGWAVAAAIPLVFLTLFFAWPIVSLVATGFITDGRFGFQGLGEVFETPRTWRVIAQTLAQASIATTLSLVLGVPVAFVLYRLQFRGQALLRGLLTVPFVLPTVVVGVAFISLLGPGGPLNWLGLDQSLGAIVLALTFFNVTVVMRTVGGFWSQLDSRPEQAALMLGASPSRVWWTITLPALGPALASAASLVFLFCSTSFGIVLVLGGRAFSNIETEVYRLTMQFLDLRSAAVLSLAQFAIVGAAIFASNQLRKRREQVVSMQTSRHRPISPKKKHWPILTVFALTAVLLHGLPIVTLLRRSLLTADGQFTTEHYKHLFLPPAESPLSGSVMQAVGLSVQMALIASGIAMLLGTLVALVASRQPRQPIMRRLIELFDGFAMLPLGVSAVTLGLGLLLTMHQPLGVGIDLRTSVVLIPIAQALVALPLVVRTMLPVLRGIDPRIKEAATMLGAAPGRVLRTIDLAMLGKSAGLALGFALATSLGEFGATAFLVRSGQKTLPVVVAELISHQAPSSYGMGLAAAVLLGALTAGVMMLAEQLRPAGRMSEW